MKRVTKLDKAIGQKIFDLRTASGLSREQLALKIGITHQQLHKYERGTNRIYAGRLCQLAKILNIPLAYFFDGGFNPEIICQSETLTLKVSRNFRKIKDKNMQEAIHRLIVTLVGE